MSVHIVQHKGNLYDPWVQDIHPTHMMAVEAGLSLLHRQYMRIYVDGVPLADHTRALGGEQDPLPPALGEAQHITLAKRLMLDAVHGLFDNPDPDVLWRALTDDARDRFLNQARDYITLIEG
jgi:hypothetical protein